ATSWAYLRRQLEPDRLILTGQVTERCILYTALDAYIRHFHVVVPKDGVAHIDADLGDAALRMMEGNMRAELAVAEKCLGGHRQGMVERAAGYGAGAIRPGRPVAYPRWGGSSRTRRPAAWTSGSGTHRRGNVHRLGNTGLPRAGLAAEQSDDHQAVHL